MNIRPINALAGLKRSLEAPADERLEHFEELVIEPLRPFWSAWLARMPSAAQEAGPPSALELARRFNFFSPVGDIKAGLEALEKIERAGAWPASVTALERAVAALEPETRGVELSEVLYTFLLADPEAMDESTDGYTGVGGHPGQVMLLAWPTAYNLPRLPAVVAHEFNHNVRFSVEPWTPATTVGQHIVAEGLAEAFAAELYGEEMLGRWATTLKGAELDALRPRFREALEVSGFNETRGYVFGDWAAEAHGYKPQGLPDFAGYAMGYRLVRAYLERTGATAAEATYVPWREIVARSGYP